MADPDFDVRLHKASCAPLLQTVRTPVLPNLTALTYQKSIFTNGRVVYVIQAMIAVVVIWTVGFFLSNLLQCIPFSVNWTGWGGAVDACINTNAMFLAQAWSDVITDGNGLQIDHGKRVSDMLSSPDPLPTLAMCMILLSIP